VPRVLVVVHRALASPQPEGALAVVGASILAAAAAAARVTAAAAAAAVAARVTAVACAAAARVVAQVRFAVRVCVALGVQDGRANCPSDRASVAGAVGHDRDGVYEHLTFRGAASVLPDVLGVDPPVADTGLLNGHVLLGPNVVRVVDRFVERGLAQHLLELCDGRRLLSALELGHDLELIVQHHRVPPAVLQTERPPLDLLLAVLRPDAEHAPKLERGLDHLHGKLFVVAVQDGLLLKHGEASGEPPDAAIFVAGRVVDLQQQAVHARAREHEPLQVGRRHRHAFRNAPAPVVAPDGDAPPRSQVLLGVHVVKVVVLARLWALAVAVRRERAQRVLVAGLAEIDALAIEFDAHSAGHEVPPEALRRMHVVEVLAVHLLTTRCTRMRVRQGGARRRVRALTSTGARASPSTLTSSNGGSASSRCTASSGITSQCPPPPSAKLCSCRAFRSASWCET
jgi:hypothetical protein